MKILLENQLNQNIKKTSIFFEDIKESLTETIIFFFRKGGEGNPNSLPGKGSKVIILKFPCIRGPGVSIKFFWIPTYQSNILSISLLKVIVAI